MYRRFSLWVLLSLPVVLHAQEMAGSQICAACHPGEAQRHASSAHAQALRPVVSSPAGPLFDRAVRERGGLEFSYVPMKRGLAVTATLQGESETAVLEWIFGAGVLAFTPVGQRNGSYFEHRISWYSALQRPGVTLGHSATPATAGAALGQVQTPDTITRCFQCHATGVKPGPDLSAMTPGVQCERCHGPGAAHSKAPSSTNIRKLSVLPPLRSIEMCAGCHRLPEAPSNRRAHQKRDPLEVRFAPVGLLASRCFQSSQALACTTCHDPHGGSGPAKGVFESKCLECHGTGLRPHGDGCLECHMKKTSPVPGLTFTDHRIRIYR